MKRTKIVFSKENIFSSKMQINICNTWTQTNVFSFLFQLKLSFLFFSPLSSLLVNKKSSKRKTFSWIHSPLLINEKFQLRPIHGNVPTELFYFQRVVQEKVVLTHRHQLSLGIHSWNGWFWSMLEEPQ